MSVLPCRKCQGSGYESNDPKPHEPFCCDCNGSGSQLCDRRNCEEVAIGFDEDGNALCADCLSDWTTERFSP